MSRPSRTEVARSFRAFAPHCVPSSPLYHDLALRVAEDAELLDLAAEARPGQPPANMLFGAAHDLLLRGAQHEAAAYYPSVGGARAPGAAAFAAFRDLCLGRRDELLALLRTRLTQTNETRRCAYLLPAFAAVAELGEGRPLALVEIGPSAGLNMLWDRYGYSYGDGSVYGDAASPVQITTELRGPARPPIPERPPAVAWRVGVDLSPVDLEDADAVRWLEALVWPENLERLGRLRAAVALARAARPRIIAGDALGLLPGLLAEAPEGATLCVYHTHVTYQLTPELRGRLDGLLAEAGRRRPLLRLSCEGFGAEHPQLTLDSYGRGVSGRRLLALTTGHANWIAWQTA
jgi:hypothetical protein